MSYPPPPTYPTHLLSTAPSATSYLVPPPISRPPRRPLHPFLGPRAHLSLSWLSQPFLSLLLVLVALGFLLSAVPPLVSEAKTSLAAACLGVEGAAGVAVSLPHYMAEGVNEMNVRAVRAVTEGAGEVLDMALYAAEKIIIFIIDVYRSLFLCLLDVLIHGSITLLVEAIEEAQEFVSDTVSGLRTAIRSSISGVESAIESAVGLIDKIPGVDVDIPDLSIPELSSLENITLPSTLVDALTSLNSSIPTYDDLRAQLATLISTPIDALRSEINNTLSNSSASIDVELLPVPAKESIALCADLDTSWVDDVGADLSKFVKLAIGLVVLALVLLVAACAVWERYRYRAFLAAVSDARGAWLADLSSSSPSQAPETLSTPHLLTFLQSTPQPLLTRLTSFLSRLLHLRTPPTRAHLSWFLSYIAHPSAWASLALGLTGLLVVQLQIAALEGPVKRAVEQKASDGADSFTAGVTAQLEEKWTKATAEWANGTNGVILGLQGDIDDKLFGWVDNTTTSINTTINTFYDGITDELTAVFNGTVLQDPILNLVYCLLGSKVSSLSSALTWLHDHAHITLPLVEPAALLPSNSTTAELSSSLSSTDSPYSAPSVAGKMLERYRESLEQQRLGFALAIGVWALVVLMGLVGVVWRERDARRGVIVERAEEGEGEGEGDEKRRGFGGLAKGLKPLHLRSFSSPASRLFHRPGAVSSRFAHPAPFAEQDLSTLDLPPSPAYARLPLPGETTALGVGVGADLAPNHDAHGLGSGRSWASLVEFFRPSSPSFPAPSSSAPPAPARRPLNDLKSTISRPLARSSFAPTAFAALPRKAERERERWKARVRGVREKVRQRGEERGRGEGGEGAWERMPEPEQEQVEEGAGPFGNEHSAPASAAAYPAYTARPVDPFADPRSPAAAVAAGPPVLDPFRDPLSPPSPLSLPFPRATPSTMTNPFVDPAPPPARSGANPFAHPPPPGRAV
ncbi:hypothetical protein JCM10207_000047 [Rhodosporidiobolus poonsookiae]